MVDIISRKAWGAQDPKRAYTSYKGSEGILGHHLGDGVKREPRRVDYAALMRQTQAFHMGPSRNWNDFAYGFGIGGGRAYMGRGFGVIDGADTDRGRLMHSVLWLGDSTVNEIPEEDILVWWALVEEHDRRYGHKTIGGHKDVNPTGCPGDSFYRAIQKGRPIRVPTYPSITVKDEEMAQYTVKNAHNVSITYRIENQQVVASWRNPDGHRTPWEIIRQDLNLKVVALQQPLVNGPGIWLPMSVRTDAYGVLLMSLIQGTPGARFELISTDELEKYFEGLPK